MSIAICTKYLSNIQSLMTPACRFMLGKARYAAVIFLGVVGFDSLADDFRVVLKNHVFVPAEIIVPAGKKVRLVIYNQDESAEEFDSFDLNREKVLFPNKKAVIFIGPLKAGRYEYFGEFHPESAQGVVIAKSMEEIKND
ncbi:cupredoxin domain-containing protein [Psychrosphaera aestuarii]|uniref:cupredoxin domain-containing protein n=1 Tax=Psychrosphaera aestuarii TaxID=1266052 RepID=UPI003CC7C9A5